MLRISLTIIVCLAAAVCFAEDRVVVKMNLVDSSGIGKEIGTITAITTPFGTLFTPALSDLPPGMHGFHIHQNPDCGPKEKEGKPVPGLAAGGHYDPADAKVHEGPYGKGHLGDLPALYVDAGGKATLPVLAPHVKLGDLKGRSVMIHAGGDNYSDHPEPLGGGGARIACGVIK